MSTHTERFATYQTRTRALRTRALALVESIQACGWRIAAAAGIPRDGCALHNASIDDALRGWCAGNPERLRAARRTVAVIDGAWIALRIADRMERRLFRIAFPEAPAPRLTPRPAVNAALLFSQP